MNPPRDTTTGNVMEEMVPLALAHGGYTFQAQKFIGQKFGGRRHKIDLEVTNPRDGETFLVSLKWQQKHGTTEEKIPFEVMVLAAAVESSQGRYKRAFIVLGGDGWELRDFYLQGGLGRYLANCDAVRIVDMYDFIAKANDGRL